MFRVFLFLLLLIIPFELVADVHIITQSSSNSSTDFGPAESIHLEHAYKTLLPLEPDDSTTKEGLEKILTKLSDMELAHYSLALKGLKNSKSQNFSKFRKRLPSIFPKVYSDLKFHEQYSNKFLMERLITEYNKRNPDFKVKKIRIMLQKISGANPRVRYVFALLDRGGKVIDRLPGNLLWDSYDFLTGFDGVNGTLRDGLLYALQSFHAKKFEELRTDERREERKSKENDLRKLFGK